MAERRLYHDHGVYTGLGHPITARVEAAIVQGRGPLLEHGSDTCAFPSCSTQVSLVLRRWGFCLTHIELLPDGPETLRALLQRLYQPGAKQQSPQWRAAQWAAIQYLQEHGG